MELQSLASRGRADVLALLEGPPFPESLRYMHTWLSELHGRSGVGMNGYLPLTWSTLDAWARMTDSPVQPHEARALVTLDAIMCFPGKPEDDE